MSLGKLFHPAESVQPVYLIAGLGNPGVQYRLTRHNVGFLTLDRLAERLQVKFSRLENKALLAKAEYQGSRILLAKPHTYMNLSGQSVGALMRYYKVPHTNIMVCYDDVDLPLGSIRLRPGGGSAGQKGMASIIEKIGTQDFPRLRLGIGRPPGRMDAAAYVLQEFSASEKEHLHEALERAVEAILLFVSESLDAAMNRYNGATDRN